MVESYGDFCPVGEQMTRMTALALCMISTQAGAVECFALSDLTAMLYSEEKRQLITAKNLDNQLQIFVDSDGNYAMIIVTPDKQACMVATGKDMKVVNWNE